MKKATHCRFCHLPGDLIKGAHKECKNNETRERLRVRNGINPANYLYVGDRGKCAKCDKPAERLSKLNLCREHMKENAREVILKAKRKHMKKVRSSPEHKQPRVYVKPPTSQKLVRVTRTEKKELPLPLLNTDEEKEKMAVLLKKAAEHRTLLNFSRWD